MKNNSKTRVEKDTLGSVEVPADSYSGAFTQRAKENFQISKTSAPKAFIEALGLVKLAAAKTNTQLGLLEKTHFKAIEQACHEFIEGKFDHEFSLDTFQAGAGTSYNMNANEILANRANEILNGKKHQMGNYSPLHPNNHINMAQSTNDVIPTATRLATLIMLPELLSETYLLEEAINKKAKKYRKTVKIARTHLMDAVPITLEQSLGSYSEALKKSRQDLENTSVKMQELGIGATAAGTGLNSHPDYRTKTIENLIELIGIELRPAKNLTEMLNNMNSFLAFSSTLRQLATNLLNFCGDLKIMNMGPYAGLSEISLPEVQPGSSIMPGKINPSIPESVEMVCFQVLGNDKVIELASQRSNFELNVYCPIIMQNLLFSMEILTSAIRTLREKAINGMTINTAKIASIFEQSLSPATALNPYLGYELTAKIVKSALKKSISIREEIKSKNLLTEEELNLLFSTGNLTAPGKINGKLQKKLELLKKSETL